MTNHTIQLKDRRPNTEPTQEDVEKLACALSSWYVRMDGKYYDVADPRNKFSKDDITAASIHRFREECAETPLTPELFFAAVNLAAETKSMDPNLNIPTWNGSLRCLPQEGEKLVWNNGMVTINSWSKPPYRLLAETEGDPGTVMDFLEFIFDRNEDLETYLNWLAWCLQNEEDKPTWGPLLYSKSKGTGKSTLCDIAKRLFGERNTLRQNNIDKLTSRFNLQLMLKKFIISEELDIRQGTNAANALKTFMTEKDAVSEAKGREVEHVEQCFCCMFTTNHIPLWIEENDRRYWIVEIDHEGRAGGKRGAEFSQLVGNLHAYLDRDEHVARLYRWLMARELPQDFTGKTFDASKYPTPIMELIFGNNGQTNHDLMRELLNKFELNAVSEAGVVKIITNELRANPNSTRHIMTELGWRKRSVKWGGKDYQRAIWTRPEFQVYRGKIIGSDGSEGPLMEVRYDKGTLWVSPDDGSADTAMVETVLLDPPVVKEDEVY